MGNPYNLGIITLPYYIGKNEILDYGSTIAAHIE